MIITVSNTLTIDNPSAELLVWCSKHMRIANPEYQKKVRMNLWLGNTPKTLCLYEQRGTSIVLPFGTLRSLPESVRKNAVFIGDFKAAEEVSYRGVDIPLYDYQKAAVDAVAAGQYGILQSPAGSGKTQMGIALVKRFGKKALWLTHTLDLLRQSKERAELYMDKRVIGTITEGKVSIGSGITFATMLNGKINPMAGVFLGVNNYGYQDVKKVDVTPVLPDSNKDNDYDPDSIRERYLIDSNDSDSDSDND